jgi:uncharacterized protein
MKSNTIKIKVQPKSSRNYIEKIDEGEYKAYLRSAPVDGRANEELIKLLAKELKVKKYQVEIIKGFRSKDKVVKIS